MSKIIVVSGLGRCGSTMVMKMLDAGGLPVIGNKVSYEDMRCIEVTKASKWLEEAQGHGIKILDIQRQSLPGEFQYKVIWVRRDFKQQAKCLR